MKIEVYYNNTKKLNNNLLIINYISFYTVEYNSVKNSVRINAVTEY